MKNRFVIASAASVLAAAGMAHAQSFTEAFDDIVTLTASGGWFTQNNSAPIGGLNYFQGNTAVFPAHASAGYLGVNYNSGGGLATISNWFVTPMVSLQNGQTFSFYTRTVDAPAFPDRLQIRMSLAGASTNVGTAATDLGDFTNLLLDINPTYTTSAFPTAWTQYTVSISGVPVATNGRLAFRYFVENAGPAGANSDYIGIDTAEYSSTAQPTGACCITATGACVPNVTSAACTAQGGVYQGNASTCGSVVCPQPSSGACCLFSGTCSILTPAGCTAQGGVYQGNGSVCGTCPTPPPVIYSNCNIKTGPTTLSGTAAPAGSEWSEVARDSVDSTNSNTVAGFGAAGALRIADDFVVPAGGMNLGYVKVFGYTSGVTTPAVTAATLRILNGPPTGTPTVVFGDQTTNRLAANTMSNIYRTFNTVSAPTCGGVTTAPGTTRRLQEIYIAVNTFLPAGTYWIDFNFTGVNFAPPSTSSTAIGRQCNPQNSNGLQFNGAWVNLDDTGQGCVLSTVQQDAYFELLGASAAASCYANCDNSTNPPCLNVNDFVCFNNAYSANSAYANCDASTIAPVLNVNDFVCFNNKYSAGCASPCSPHP